MIFRKFDHVGLLLLALALALIAGLQWRASANHGQDHGSESRLAAPR